MMSPPSGQENIFLDGEYKLQISASDGGRGRGQTAGDTLCGRAELFSRAETRICSQSSDTNAGRTAERFNKPDWDRNYFWLPQPKRLINGIFWREQNEYLSGIKALRGGSLRSVQFWLLSVLEANVQNNCCNVHLQYSTNRLSTNESFFSIFWLKLEVSLCLLLRPGKWRIYHLS